MGQVELSPGYRMSKPKTMSAMPVISGQRPPRAIATRAIPTTTGTLCIRTEIISMCVSFNCFKGGVSFPTPN